MKARVRDTGLLILRLGLGVLMIVGHGWPKVQNFSSLATRFADPFGIGSQPSLLLAIGAEIFCSIFLILGFATRLVSVPLLFTMLVAAFYAHAGDPWAKKEMALLYALPYLSLILTGAGRFSLDEWIRRKRG